VQLWDAVEVRICVIDIHGYFYPSTELTERLARSLSVRVTAIFGSCGATIWGGAFCTIGAAGTSCGRSGSLWSIYNNISA